MIRFIVSGGRDYRDYAHVKRVLDEERPGVIITGECPTRGQGADGLAKRWARENGVPLIGVYAHFDYYGPKAGPIRDGWMFDIMAPVYKLVAFPGGRGTSNAVEAAYAREILVRDERRPSPDGRRMAETENTGSGRKPDQQVPGSKNHRRSA